MKVDRSQLFAIITLAALLAISGIGTLCWMWGTQWSDKTGVGVGGIFIALTLLQALFTFSWWKVMQRMPEESQSGLEPVELKSLSPARKTSADRMANNEKQSESPLLHRSAAAETNKV